MEALDWWLAAGINLHIIAAVLATAGWTCLICAVFMITISDGNPMTYKMFRITLWTTLVLTIICVIPDTRDARQVHCIRTSECSNK